MFLVDIQQLWLKVVTYWIVHWLLLVGLQIGRNSVSNHGPTTIFCEHALQFSLSLLTSRMFKLQENIVKWKDPIFDQARRYALSIHSSNAHSIFLGMLFSSVALRVGTVTTLSYDKGTFSLWFKEIFICFYHVTSLFKEAFKKWMHFGHLTLGCGNFSCQFLHWMICYSNDRFIIRWVLSMVKKNRSTWIP